MRANTKNLIVIGICFAILAIPQLLLNQESVGFDALAWVAAVVVAGGVFGVFVPRSAHLYLLVVVSGWLFFGVGLAETASVLLWLASTWSLGVLVLRRLYPRTHDLHINAVEAILVGTAILLAVWGGMLHFAVNYQALYLLICVSPCLALAFQTSIIHTDFRHLAVAVQNWMRSIPLWAWIAGLAIIGWVLRWASFPTMGYDDHAQHLRIWTEILAQKRYAFDVNTQIWSVAPFVVDLLHAGLSLMAGYDARSAMNLVLAISLLLLMAQILQNWKLPAWVQWLLMVLMVSTPMLGNLLLSLQTELMLSVLAMAGMRLVIDANGGWRGQHVLGVFACAALCAGIKLPGAVLGMTLLAALVAHWWSQRATPIRKEPLLRWPALLLLIPLGFVAFHSYVLAWNVTGNPVFPLYNAIFLSPFFPPENFSDVRWIHGFTLSNYVRAFFYTSEFFETRNYTAGWQYLFLLPIAILSVFRSSVPSSLRVTLLPILGFGLVMFSATQYWRYLFPVMPIAGTLFAALFVINGRIYRALILALAIVCIVLNIAYFTRVSWMMHSPAATAFTREGKSNLIRRYAPVALLTEKLNQLAPNARVLYPSSTPYGATLHGDPLYIIWYAPFRAARAASAKTLEGISGFLAQERVSFVIFDMGSDVGASGEPESLLREHLARFGAVIAQEGSFLLYKLNETPFVYRKIFDLHAATNKPSGEVNSPMPLAENGILATKEPKRVAVFETHHAKQARYSIDFSCPTAEGFFVAQINWDKGEAYYQLLACKSKHVSFKEAIPVPIGANTGALYITTRDTASLKIENLSVEIN